MKELWLVDSQVRTVEVLYNEGNRWERQPPLSEGEFVSSRVIPGLKLSITRNFAE